MSQSTDIDRTAPLVGRRVAFVGRLGGMNRREAQRLVRELGGAMIDSCAEGPDLVVLGAEELPVGDSADAVPADVREAAAAGRVEILSETQFWQRLGLVDAEQHVQQLYTPAHLAKLLELPVSVVRSWHRRGLIRPLREVHRLPYFDFREVTWARQLARLVAAGASPAEIERQLADLVRFVPEVERPLAQLPVLVEGRKLLLRQGQGLIESGGQLRLNFDEAAEEVDEETTHLFPLAAAGAAAAERDSELPLTASELFEQACRHEEEGDLNLAAELCRAAMAAGGPTPEACFQLADLLYRLGDISAARERYYMALELDENYVEARANLGCVLAELGQAELAIAAFRGALAYHEDYADVHYHLAHQLDARGESADATEHWRAFLALAPDSPWAEEARERLATEAQES